jgi:hydrogenase maturation protease
MYNTLVVGLGNPILSDDGVGVIVAYEVAQLLESKNRNDVTVTEASVGGLRLMELMIGYDRVILVDAIIGSNGSLPGDIHHMNLDDLRDISPTQHSTCAHDTSLVTALDLGKKLGFAMPSEISIYAIEVSNIMDFNDELTPEVAAAVPITVSAVLAELNGD